MGMEAPWSAIRRMGLAAGTSRCPRVARGRRRGDQRRQYDAAAVRRRAVATERRCNATLHRARDSKAVVGPSPPSTRRSPSCHSPQVGATPPSVPERPGNRMSSFSCWMMISGRIRMSSVCSSLAGDAVGEEAVDEGNLGEDRARRSRPRFRVTRALAAEQDRALVGHGDRGADERDGERRGVRRGR